MSYIALEHVPNKWNLQRLNLFLSNSKLLKGNFESVNFNKSRGPNRIAYIRISEKLDPIKVIEHFNEMANMQFKASIPDHVPDFPVPPHLHKLPLTMSSKSKNLVNTVTNTHKDLMEEIVCKYTGLYSLSKKTNNKLLQELSETVLFRLKDMADTNKEAIESSFKLSKIYRKAHPHFADFQLVLSTLHRVEDAAGTPRTQVLEHELSALPAEPTIDYEFLVESRKPNSEISRVASKYADRIIKKVRRHISQLETKSLGDSPEGVARKRVREALMATAPYLPMMIRQIVANNFTPQNKQKVHILRIYGEPYLPKPEVMAPFMKRACAIRATRSSRVYNMMRIHIPVEKYEQAIALDGTVVGGATLVVRPSKCVSVQVKPLRKEVVAHTLGVSDDAK